MFLFDCHTVDISVFVRGRTVQFTHPQQNAWQTVPSPPTYTAIQRQAKRGMSSHKVSELLGEESAQEGMGLCVALTCHS